MSYTKLHESILTSTIWGEDSDTRVVWVTMLAMANEHGEVESTIPGLARIACVPIEKARAAIDKFMSPDPDSRTPDNEGRRLAKIDGGWLLLNHELYRLKCSKDDKRNQAAIRQNRKRDKEKQLEAACHAASRSVTHVSRSVTLCHDEVTQERDIAEAEAEAENKQKDTSVKKPTTEKFDARSLSLPGVLSSPEFSACWVDWIQHRNEIKKRLTRKSAEMQLAALAEMGPTRAIAAIKHSIASGWTGVFEPTTAAAKTAPKKAFFQP
jgi:hypothetical protein